ncbi:MAG: hypothetical protein CMQ11_13135 [Gammaproteobacteria bacterium]|nr:hypothetical protein [Gammaproteobacteria bacterium]
MENVDVTQWRFNDKRGIPVAISIGRIKGGRVFLTWIARARRQSKRFNGAQFYAHPEAAL